MEAVDNWREEKRSAYLYRALSKIESNPVHKKLFQDLSSMADRQAAIWEKKMEAAHIKIPIYHPDLRTNITIKLVQCFGVRALKLALAAMKVRGMSIYLENGVSHPFTLPINEEDQHRNIKKGNTLRAAVFGINDGLISNASLILGIAGAQAGQSLILLTGIAGLLAGACSMGAGEYISVRSQREMLEYQLKLEKDELMLYPEEEAMELALIYEARGIPKEEAEKIATILIKNPEKALDTLAREELGIDPNDLVSPWAAAIASFFTFSVGAFIPLIPYTLTNSAFNLAITILLTAITLFSVGATLSLFTQRNAFLSGLRMLLIGGLAGLLTYMIGGFLGVKV